jgi:NAD-dependent dihydropyrimidine dehydrogenase PreA subunit
MVDIQVNKELCDGCGNCVEACTVEVLELHEEKATPVNPGTCMLCLYCEVECPKEAIKVFE